MQNAKIRLLMAGSLKVRSSGPVHLGLNDGRHLFETDGGGGMADLPQHYFSPISKFQQAKWIGIFLLD